MSESRQSKIETLAGDGNLPELKKLLELEYSQLELDTALENAIAYSQLEIAEYLLSLGADFSNYNYQGVYYAVHNDELAGLQYAISKGVDINVRNGILLNEGIMTAINTKSVALVQWLLDNGADAKLLTKESMDLIERNGTQELRELIKGTQQV